MKNKKLKILWIRSSFPYKDRCGGEWRSWILLKILKNIKRYDIKFIFFEKEISEGNKKYYINEIYKILLGKEKFEIIFIEIYYLVMELLSLIRAFQPQSKVIVDSHDLSYIKNLGTKKYGHNFLSSYINKEKNKEIKVYRQADLVITTTDNDKKVLEKEGITTPIVTIPTPYQYVYVNKIDKKLRKDLLFIGYFFHHPNEDGIIWFVKKIFPKIKKHLPRIKLYLIGEPTKKILSLSKTYKDVIVKGRLKTTTKYLKKCKIFVAPIRYGSGINGKIIEAMFAQMPVVTTQDCVKRMGLKEGYHVLVGRTEKDFAKKVIELYKNKTLQKKLVKNSLKLARKRYSFKMVKKNLVKVIDNINFLIKRPLTSIIIPCYNELKYTQECIDSILERTNWPYEIIVVNNGSTDGTLNWILKKMLRFKNIRLVNNKINLGYAKGCNQGIRVSKGEYIVLLNNDTIVCRGWLENMIDKMKSDKKIGCVVPIGGSVRMNFKHKSFSEKKEKIILKGSYISLNKFYKVYTGVPGFCVLIKKDIVKKVGFLNESYGIYGPVDFDYFIRLEKLGYEVVFAENSFVFHYGNVTIKSPKTKFLNPEFRKFYLNKRKSFELLLER